MWCWYTVQRLIILCYVMLIHCSTRYNPDLFDADLCSLCYNFVFCLLIFSLLFYPWFPSVWFFHLHTFRKLVGDVITRHRNDTTRNSVSCSHSPASLFLRSCISCYFIRHWRFCISHLLIFPNVVNLFLGEK